MLTPESITSPTAVKTMTGSTLIYSASSLEEVQKIVESDVYYTAGVVRLFVRLPTAKFIDRACIGAVGPGKAGHHPVCYCDTSSLSVMPGRQPVGHHSPSYDSISIPSTQAILLCTAMKMTP